MKMTMNQEVQRRNQYQNQQKSSFISSGHKPDPPSNEMHNRNCVEDRENLDNNDIKNAFKPKDSLDNDFKKIFVEDTQSTKHFSRRENYLSSENLRVSFKGLLNQVKNVRESQNIHTNDNFKTPPNSLNQKKMSNTKSAANFVVKPNEQFLVIKTDTNEKGEESEQTKQLKKKIQELQQFNERIKQQNIQLRLIKFSSNEQSMQLLALKLEIQEWRRKIQKIKHEDSKNDWKVRDYSASRRYGETNKDPMMTPNIYYYNTPPTIKPRVSETEIRSNHQNPKTTTTSLYFQNPYAINNTNIVQNKNPLAPLSPTLTKSRAIEQSNNHNPLKKNSKIKPSDIKFGSSSAHEQAGKKTGGAEFNNIAYHKQ